MRSSQNALVHGECTNEVREMARRFGDLMRLMRDIRNNMRSQDEE